MSVLFLLRRRFVCQLPLGVMTVLERPPQVPVYPREHKGSCRISHIAPFCPPPPRVDPRTTARRTLYGKPPAAQGPAASLLVERGKRHWIRKLHNPKCLRQLGFYLQHGQKVHHYELYVAKT